MQALLVAAEASCAEEERMPCALRRAMQRTDASERQLEAHASRTDCVDRHESEFGKARAPKVTKLLVRFRSRTPPFDSLVALVVSSDQHRSS